MHVVDTTMFFSARSGGVKRYLLAKHEWLARCTNVRHTLLVPPPQPRNQGLATAPGLSIRLPDGYRFPLSYFHWSRALRALEPDLIEAGDPYLPSWAARETATRLGVPSVAFYHSDMARMLALRVGGWIGPVAGAYLQRLYCGFDLVLAPSRIMLRCLHEARIHNARLQPLGVDTNIFTPDVRDPSLRDTLGLRQGTRLMVYAGRFAAEKNIQVLLETARRLGSPYHLLMIGGRAAKRIDSNVTLIPYQRNPRRLATWLASCDVFLHAGTFETYGLVAVEAMACGVPVVAVAQGALMEIVDDEVGALTSRAHADELAQAVQGVFDRDIVRLSRSARDRAVHQHDWDCAFRQLLSHYAVLANRASLQTQSLQTELEG